MTDTYAADGSDLFITVPSTVAYGGGELVNDMVLPVTIGGVNAGTAVRVTIREANGPVTLAVAGGATVTTAADGQTVTVAGTRDAVNATLATLVVPRQDDQFTFTASDATVTTGASMRVESFAFGQVALAVPSRALLGSLNPVLLPPMHVYDLQYSNGTGNVLSVTLSAAHGVLFVSDLSLAPGVVVTGAGTASMTIIGVLQTVDAALSFVRYVGGTAAADTITVTASDGLTGAVLGSASVPVTLQSPGTVGQAFTWSGPSGGAWGTPGDWTTAGPPRAPNLGDTVVLPGGADIITGAGAAASLGVVGGYVLTGTVDDAGALTVSGLLQVLGASSLNQAVLSSSSATIAGGAGNAAELDVTTGSWANAGALQVGGPLPGVPGQGVIDIRNGGVVGTGSLSIGAHGLVSVVSTGTLNVAGTLTVGDAVAGAGSNGTLVAAGSLSADSLVLHTGASVLTKGVDSLNSLVIDSGALFGGVSAIRTAKGGATNVINNGTIDGPVALLPLELTGSIAGTGLLVVDAGGGLLIDGPVAATQALVFRPGAGPLPIATDASAGGELILRDVPDFHATIQGFAPGDIMLVTAATAITTAVVGAGNLLLFRDAGGNMVEQLQLDPGADYSGLAFRVLAGQSDPFSGTAYAANQYLIEAAPRGEAAPAITTSGGARVVAGQSGVVPLVSVRAPAGTSGTATFSTTFTTTTGTFSELSSLGNIGSLIAGGGFPGAGDGSLTGTDESGNTINLLTVGGTGTQSLTISGSNQYLVNLQTALALYQSTGTAGPVTIAIASSVTSNGTTSSSAASVPFTVAAAPVAYAWRTGGTQASGSAANWISSDGTAGPPGAGDPTTFGVGSYAVTGDISTGAARITGDALLTGAVYVDGALTVDQGGGGVFAGAFYSTGSVVVGQVGNGSVNYSGLLNLIQGDLVVGGGASGYLQTDATTVVAGTFQVGVGGSGAVDVGTNTASNILSGASLQTHAAQIGVTGGQTGTVVVNGVNWTDDTSLVVGVDGSGLLEINDPALLAAQGEVDVNDVVVGQDAGALGAVSIDDQGVLRVYDALTVGQSGSGSLTVSGAGQILFEASGKAGEGPSTYAFAIGAGAGSHGSVVIDSGSTTAGVVSVGGTATAAGGTGTLTVENTALNAQVQLTTTAGQYGTTVYIPPGLVGNRLVVWSGGSATFNGIAGFGEVDVNGGILRISAGALTLDATLQDKASPNPAPGLNVAAGGTVIGSGRLYTAPVVTGVYDAMLPAGIVTQNAGLIQADGGMLEVEALANTGTLVATAGNALQIGAPFGFINVEAPVNDGRISAAGGTVVISAPVVSMGGRGTLGVSGGGTLTLGDGSSASAYRNLVDAGQTVAFEGPGTLSLNPGDGEQFYANGTDNFLGAVMGFSTGDAVDFNNHATGIVGYSGGVLTLAFFNNIAGTTALNVGSGYALDQFHLVNTGVATSELTVQVACYCPGTRIGTPFGEAPVETLAIGDLVTTASGEMRPVKWIGRRNYDARTAAGQPDLLPIRIRAGALGDGLPRRDLLVSALHAMLVEGVLAPAGLLVNGASIIVEPVGPVHYVHVELESHDCILAEGAASETFVDDHSRAMFHNAAEYAALYPGAAAASALYCAPRLEGGYALDAIRRRILARARAVPGPGSLRGRLDGVADGRIWGWAQDEEHPEAPVALEIMVGGRVAYEVLASAYRPDLAEARIGSGRHAFALPWAGSAGPVSVRRASDGAALQFGPGVQVS